MGEGSERRGRGTKTKARNAGRAGTIRQRSASSLGSARPPLNDSAERLLEIQNACRMVLIRMDEIVAIVQKVRRAKFSRPRRRNAGLKKARR
jgi:hypothetical protein